MSKLEDLKRQKQQIELEIGREEKSEAERKRALDLHENYFKVACPDCRGTGEVSQGGADIESDPPWLDTCKSCRGDGWLYARKWMGMRAEHDMEHSQVTCP